MVSPKIRKEGGKTIVTMPVCRRIAGKIKCEEEGLRIVYRGASDLEGPIEITAKSPEGAPVDEEMIRFSAWYVKGQVGPVKVEKKIEK